MFGKLQNSIRIRHIGVPLCQTKIETETGWQRENNFHPGHKFNFYFRMPTTKWMSENNEKSKNVFLFCKISGLVSKTKHWKNNKHWGWCQGYPKGTALWNNSFSFRISVTASNIWFFSSILCKHLRKLWRVRSTLFAKFREITKTCL